MLRIYSLDADRLVLSVYNPDKPETVPVNAVWYDLYDPTIEEDHFVESCLGIPIPTRDEMKDIEPSARLYHEGSAEIMTITGLTKIASDNPSKAPVTFVLRGDQLVTVRYIEPRSFAIFAARAQRAAGRTYITGEQVMIGILEAMIDRVATILETAGDEIDAISREVFRNKTRNATRKTRDLQSLLERIGREGDVLTLVRESMVSMLRLSTFHQTKTMPNTKHAKDIRQDVKILQRDAQALSDHAAFLASKVNFLLDATLGLISLEQNAIIKIFSVAAVVFLPPTLVASIYGMNFAFMPELNWPFGYPMALCMMVASAVLPYLFFKRRGWL